VLSEILLDQVRRITMTDNRVTFETIRVPEDMKFSSLESEQCRTYVFPDKDVVIEEPVALNVSRSGGHRVITSSGKVHYIPTGWVDLIWEVYEGAMHVDF
jgi:hypothetical protein